MALLTFWRATFCILLVLVSYLSLTSAETSASASNALISMIAEALFKTSKYNDKVAHFIAYFALGGAFVLARFEGLSAIFARKRPISIRAGMLGILVVFGIAMEGLQSLTVDRSPDVLDVFANTAGLMAAFPCALLFECGLSTVLNIRSHKTEAGTHSPEEPNTA